MHLGAFLCASTSVICFVYTDFLVSIIMHNVNQIRWNINVLRSKCLCVLFVLAVFIFYANLMKFRADSAQQPRRKNNLRAQLRSGCVQSKIVQALKHCRVRQCHFSLTDQSKSRRGQKRSVVGLLFLLLSCTIYPVHLDTSF